jgi:ATP-dependent DNA helicase RecG
LAKLGIGTIQDLLFHLPARYQDRTRTLPIGALQPGSHAVVEADVELAEITYTRRRMLLVRLCDGTGSLTLRFFHFSAAQQASFEHRIRLRCFGEVRTGTSTLEMVHPEYQRIQPGNLPQAEDHLTPVYPTTEGIHQLTLRSLTEQALRYLQDKSTENRLLCEWLPEEILRKHGLPDLSSAVRFVHRPPTGVSLQVLENRLHPSQQRLAFEELLAHQLSLRNLRHKARSYAAPVLRGKGMLAEQFRKNLPFALTRGQERVAREIATDMRRNHPMMRLLQGDVGAGKTVVAALAALQAIEAGWQVAVMAPTELLAEQHFRSFRSWFSPLSVQTVWISGKTKGNTRTELLEHIAQHDPLLVVGTHALFQDDVRFAHLGLIIIDEQHRFGVHQRLALRDKGAQNKVRPHQLTMTATPIPRTLAMTFYADLDLSIIDELPPGRTPVTTVAICDQRRADVIQRVRDACARKRQAYWVCTLIEESEALQCQAAEDTASRLGEALVNLRVGLVHGRMKAQDKEKIMAEFSRGEVDLLVATTVIEVGVDVPNASLMIIENAERLGLAQLHQLRGRVGRGSLQSTCVLMYRSPLSQTARARLGILRETTDGFAIARKDLELRGPGEVLGTRQTGMLNLRIADLVRDQKLLDAVSNTAEHLLREYPDRIAPLIRRWLGDTERYGNV